MSHTAQAFSQLSAQGRKGLILSITAGDPCPGVTIDLVHALVEDGSNVIELGAPFSGPTADGPVIQRMPERALAKKVGLRTVLEYVRASRAINSTTPVVLMGYANPIKRMDVEAFAEAASEVSAGGMFVVDYPPKECRVLVKTMRVAGIDPIFSLAPAPTKARIAQIARVASGCIYYVPLKGVTSATIIDPDAVAVRISQIRQHMRLPVGVGFGIHDVATARAISGAADTVVIGSRTAQSLEEVPHEQMVQYLTDFIAEIHQVLDA